MPSDERTLKNYWKYFFASLFSLSATSFFINTQGWYLLSSRGSHLSVGVGWMAFFIPGVFALPIIGTLLDLGNLKRVLLVVEALKAATLLLGILLFGKIPPLVLVLGLSVANGALYSLLFPSVYRIIKRVAPAGQETQLSNTFEIALQLSSLLATVGAGYLYQRLGFRGVLGTSFMLFLASQVMLRTMHLPPVDDGDRGWRQLGHAYLNFVGDIRTFVKNHEIRPGLFLFGLIHQFPQNLMFVSTIPLILYVEATMKKTAVEFGWMDGVFSVGALLTGAFWSRYVAASRRTSLFFIAGFFTSLFLILFNFLPATGIVPFALMLVIAVGSTTAKVGARGYVIHSIGEAYMGRMSALFQSVSSMSLMALAALVTLLSTRLSPPQLLGMFGLIYAGFTLISIPLLKIRRSPPTFLPITP